MLWIDRPVFDALKTADALGLLDKVQVTVVYAFMAVAKGKMYVADVPKSRIAEYVAEEQRRADKEVVEFLTASGFGAKIGSAIFVRAAPQR